MMNNETTVQEHANDTKTELTLSQQLLRKREDLFERIWKEDRIDEMIYYFTKMAVGFSAVYGFCLGSWSGLAQMVAGAFKMPLLLFLTLLVCAPALYAFNILFGSKLSLKQVLAVLLLKTYMISFLLVCFAPILFYFMLSTDDKSFLLLLNVLICLIGGFSGIYLLWIAMQFLTAKSEEPGSQWILQVWMGIYMFVGTQMAWTLRPFVGSQGEFALYREIGGNIYMAVFSLIVSLFR